MSKPFQPLLASRDPIIYGDLDYSNLWQSPKLDGIRAIIVNGVVLSRNMKPIPSRQVQALFGGRPELEGYDGELIEGLANDDPYSRTYSAVMAADGEGDVSFYGFDHISHPLDEYHERYNRIDANQRGIVKVRQLPVLGEENVHEINGMFLEDGFEGSMLRAFRGPTSFYKYGRSTLKAQTLLKLKELEDFEARVVGFEEEMHNGNEATQDAFGRTKRSTHAENKTGKGTLGKLIMEPLDGGPTFKVGIFKGATRDLKQSWWYGRNDLIGLYAKLQKMRYGEKDRPRHPRWIGWRDPIDMSS